MNTGRNTVTEHTFDPPPDAMGGNGQPDRLVHVNADTVRGTTEVLLLVEQFLRHSDHPVHTQLRAFCARLGWHPVCGADALLDQLGLYAWSWQRALGTTDTTKADAVPAGHTAIDATIKETA